MRFACASCDATVTVSARLSRPGFWVPYSVEARIVAFYALGWETDKILAYLRAVAMPVSRATLFRVLRRIDDPVLGIFHADNKQSTKHSVRLRGANAAWSFWTGSWQTEYSGQLAVRVDGRGEVLPPGREIKHEILRWSVVILRQYRTVFRLNTLGWIHQYLAAIGSAGVVVYKSRSDLERDFPPDGPLPVGEVTFDAKLGDAALRGPVDMRALPLTRAIVTGLRLLELNAPTSRLSLNWSSPRAFLRLGEVDIDDLFDPTAKRHA